jgi:hypothetical protein
MDRNGRILEGLSPGKSNLLEIGPSFSPIAAKRDGWRTTIVDHCSREELVAKYGIHPSLDVSRIEEVDAIWAGGALEDVVFERPAGGYDAIIASHVIEHMVDPIGFLKSAATLAAPDGRVILAVPDKRLCFDCLRPVSTTGQVLAAWRAGRTRHSAATVFDAMAYDARPADGAPSWSRGQRVDPHFVATLEHAAEFSLGYREEEGDYVDVHGWAFTPASFALILLELEALGLSPWTVAEIVEAQAVEFIAFLERSVSPPTGDILALRRRYLSIRQLEEAREQADWMLGSVPRFSSTSLEKVAAPAPAPRPSIPYVKVIDQEIATMQNIIRDVENS